MMMKFPEIMVIIYIRPVVNMKHRPPNCSAHRFLLLPNIFLEPILYLLIFVFISEKYDEWKLKYVDGKLT